jgi:hypothetical protein
MANVRKFAKKPSKSAPSQATKDGTPEQNERSDALRVRREWMRLHGFSEEEIDVHCNDDEERISLAEEQAHLRAAKILRQITPRSSELSKRATKY